MDLQATLEGFLDEQRARLSPLGHDAVRLLNQAQLMVRGGKRLRAAFCFWGYQSVQAEVADRSALLKACAALELLHASALVHDDFMDASQVRRGNQTAHRYFAHEHRAANWTGSALEYGAAGAVARWTAQGKSITYVLVTDGEAGIQSMDPVVVGPLRRE